MSEQNVNSNEPNYSRLIAAQNESTRQLKILGLL